MQPSPAATLDESAQGHATNLEERPSSPKSHYVVMSLYFYDNQVVDIAANLKLLARGELQISDLSRIYLERDQLSVEIMICGYAWLDTGTHESLIEASNFIQTIEHRQALKVSCPDEIAYRKCLINAEQLEKLAQPLAKNGYGQYLQRPQKEGVQP
jgi:glucose-1-phosphate thymidylyltransferase